MLFFNRTTIEYINYIIKNNTNFNQFFLTIILKYRKFLVSLKKKLFTDFRFKYYPNNSYFN